MNSKGSTQAGTASTSGIEYIRYAASGRNRFVTWIALLAALGGFLFGYDTGIIGQALPFVQQQFHAGTITASWIVASVLAGAGQDTRANRRRSRRTATRCRVTARQ